MTKSATIRKAAETVAGSERFAARLYMAASNPAFSGDPLDGQQLSSLYAVIAYVARGLALKPEILQVRVEVEFGVGHVASICRREFPRAIEFLLDLHVKELSSKR